MFEPINWIYGLGGCTFGVGLMLMLKISLWLMGDMLSVRFAHAYELVLRSGLSVKGKSTW